MKMILIAAAVINLAVAVIHTFVGESQVVAPLLASDAPDLVKGTLHSAWHMITVALVLSSLTLFVLSRKEETDPLNKTLPIYFGIQYIGLALVFVWRSVLYGQFFIQILMLLPIGVLSFWAGRRARKV
jgi:hypothetical protein